MYNWQHVTEIHLCSLKKYQTAEWDVQAIHLHAETILARVNIPYRSIQPYVGYLCMRWVHLTFQEGRMTQCYGRSLTFGIRGNN